MNFSKKNQERINIIRYFASKKLHFMSFLVLLLFVSACTNDEIQQDGLQSVEANNQTKALTVAEINQQITKMYKDKGSFDWSEASDLLLWSAAVHGENILTVGYGNKDESFRTQKSNRLTSIKNEIIQTIKKSSSQKAKGDILIYEDNTLNLIDVKVTDLNSVIALRRNGNIRYIEPEGFVYSGEIIDQEKSSSGCDKSGDNISSSDFGHFSSSQTGHVPWNYYDHNINQAWAYSKGSGVGVGIIDTGVSSSQPNLGYKFDDYYGSRYISKHGTYVDSWKWWATNTDGPNDKCGHGTSTAATVGAPFNNSHQFIGVAYECNLVTYRGTSDVVLNGYHERKGVAKALTELGNRSDVKIISMSIGYPWSIGRIKDAVKYAYARGKMIFAAGGTSTSFTNWYGVIFPATMSETVAVTGVEEQSTYSECDVCHKGSEIDFTFIMERGNNNHQPVLGFYDGQSSYFGGSSVATAATAGIAALVWSRYPTWSRAQILQRLKESADFYPSKNSNFGYGNINALRAVRGY